MDLVPGRLEGAALGRGAVGAEVAGVAREGAAGDLEAEAVDGEEAVEARIEPDGQTLNVANRDRRVQALQVVGEVARASALVHVAEPDEDVRVRVVDGDGEFEVGWHFHPDSWGEVEEKK